MLINLAKASLYSINDNLRLYSMQVSSYYMFSVQGRSSLLGLMMDSVLRTGSWHEIRLNNAIAEMLLQERKRGQLEIFDDQRSEHYVLCNNQREGILGIE